MGARLDRLLAEPLDKSARDMLAGIVVAISMAAGTLAFMFGEPASGVVLRVDGGSLYVADVAPWSPAREAGIEPGMLVISLNGQDLVTIPEYTYAEPAPGLDPTWLANEPVFSLTVLAQGDIAELDDPAHVERLDIRGFTNQASWWLDGSGFAPILGFAILLGGVWWLSTGRAGHALATIAIPLAAATATPLLLLPLRLVGGVEVALLVGLLAALAMVPLADGLAALVARRELRRDVRLGALVAAVAAVGVGAFAQLDGISFETALAWVVAAGSIPLIPGIAAARPVGAGATGSSTSARFVESRETLAAAATPLFAMPTLVAAGWSPFVLPILLWVAALLAVGRLTVRPLVRLATRAQLQRDLVVAAMEAERARLAADLHDEALQELTLLVRRLDAAGDEEGAALGRTIADRLRAICGDLRLPILDDLGVGPALDWLVVRIERLAGGEVRLERADGTRPPPDVELAVFRVAQEALANAVKHGRPPIVVRYRATEGGVSLSIDDAGPGIEPGAGEQATAGGHFGLLNMQQRAEQIGAILDVRRWPGGGTHVALEWRPR